MHPSWVQIAVKARRSPAAGRVTTIWYSGKILPPPTGMSDVGVSAGAVPPGAVGAAGAPGVGLAAGGAVDPLPLPQAVSAAAHTAHAAPQIPVTRARRVASGSMSLLMAAPGTEDRVALSRSVDVQVSITVGAAAM
jgi:hypothetical protein